MKQGKIVEYIDQGKFVCTICLQDKGNRLHLLTSSNREVNLSPKRALLISNSSNDVEIPREELIEKLKNCEKKREGLKKEINARELWELINEENESYEHEYLAQLAFGEDINDDHVSALVRALFENRLYFKLKDSKLMPHSKDRVALIIRQKEEEAKREKFMSEGAKWLMGVLSGNDPEEPSCKKEIVDILAQLALHGKDAAEFKNGKELLDRAGIANINEAFHLLVGIGVWTKDENLDLHRFEIPTSFKEEQLKASDICARKEIVFEGREDLRHLQSITIDGLLTRDFDDALSLEIVGDRIRIGIHIADVASSIAPDSILDQTAAERGSSLYLPCRHIPMIPPILSQDILSLRQGCDRPAISLFASFSRDGTLLEYRFLPSVINVKNQMTYDQVNEDLNKDPVLMELDKLSHQLWQKRMQKGAIVLTLPELVVNFKPDNSFSIESVEQNTPSRMIVAEFMILYNSLAAKFCHENNTPILFRTQEEPSEILARDELGYLYYVFQQRRKLKPLKIHTTPEPHCGLGLNLYTHATSPIRRYLDIVSQRQLKSLIEGKRPVYMNNTLEEMIQFINPALRDLEIIKRNRLRYWILKFLSKNIGERYKAFILDELKSRYRVVIEEFQLITEIKRQNGMIYRTGQKITVEIKRAEPRNDLLEVQICDDL